MPEKVEADRLYLFPEIEPYSEGMLAVSDLHEIHFEESGNPMGKPVLFIHGGPGGATSPKYRRLFDPTHYRIILFDQRGCGKSRPHACLSENTTWHLVADMEQLREFLEIDEWQLFGGSWGSALALAYAQKNPNRVSEMILRGIFMLRSRELLWFYQDGASIVFPDYWRHFLDPIPKPERADLLGAYYRRLTGDNERVRRQAAHAWSIWEMRTSTLRENPNYVARTEDEEFNMAFARIETHYFVNHGFFRPESQLLDDVRLIKHIPAIIVQGRYDMVCPMQTAWELHQAWPEAQFRVIADAGHSMFEPGICEELIAATNTFR